MSIRLTVLTLALAFAIFAQPRFEAASIKPAPPPTPGKGTIVHGGPGTLDPTLATFENIDLFSLTAMAYGIRRYQLIAPDWTSTARFSITARIPPGSTVEDYRRMLQNLLADRFQTTVHHEQKEMQIADLVVAKNGPKLKESEPDPTPQPEAGLQPPTSPARAPAGYNGPFRLNLRQITMEKFAALLSGLFDQPVIDATGLTGRYDIPLDALVGSNPPNPDATNAPPPLIDAVQGQLGLKLVSKRSPVDVIVIDHIEKTPTEN